MRTDIDPGILSAFENPDGVSLNLRGTVQKSRYMTVSTIGERVSFSSVENIWDNVPSQDSCYHQGTDKVHAVYAYDDYLYYSVEAALEEVQLAYEATNIAADPLCRPAIIASGDDLIIFFYADGYIRKATLNPLTGTVTALEEIIAAQQCAIHALNDEELILAYIDEGGVGLVYLYYDVEWIAETYGHRFMDTTDLLDDVHLLNFSSACKLDGAIFFYLSRTSGAVSGVKRHAEGYWSDIFEAVPADLSTFRIANTYVFEDRIHLVGQFKRVDPVGSFESDYIYCLDLFSLNGKHFSLDRNVLFFLHGHRFFAHPNTTGTSITIFDSGIYAKTTTPHQVSEVGCEKTEITSILRISGDPSESLNVALPVETFAYINDPLIKVGSRFILELGIRSLDGSFEYYKYGDYIISVVNRTIQNGKRSLSLDLMPRSLWHVSQMTHPFYLEINSRQSVFDDVDEWDNLYAVSNDNVVRFPFSVDFWGTGPVPPESHNGGQSWEILTPELNVQFSDYPTIPALPLGIKIYGWSRSGGATQKDGSGDVPSNATSPNDNFTVILIVENAVGETERVEIDNLASGYQNPPQTYYTAADGSYPVIFEAREEDGLTVGQKIRQVGIKVDNPGSDPTTFFVERIDIPTMLVGVQDFGEAWEDATVEGHDYFLELEKECFVSFSPSGFVISWDEETIPPNNNLVWDHSVYFRLKIPDYIPTSSQFYATVKNVGSTAYGFRFSGSNTVCGYTAPSPVYVNDNGFQTINPGETKDTISSRPELASIKDGYTGLYFGTTQAGSAQLLEIGYISGGEKFVLWDHNGVEGNSVVAVQKLLKFGAPSIRFAVKPYSAFNFQVVGNYSLVGAEAWGGVVGLASDGDNYIGAKTNGEEAVLFYVRSGIETILAQVEVETEASNIQIMLEHRDGIFLVYVRDTPLWNTPAISYKWVASNGPLALDEDTLHVGIYALRDAPAVRICSFDAEASTVLGVMPLSSLAKFPEDGQISISGSLYRYSNLHALPAEVGGPFQARNTGTGWSYTNDGRPYSGNSIEITRFEWLNNALNYLAFQDYIAAGDNGIAFVIGANDFKPFITTAGVKVILKNRTRPFGNISGDHFGLQQRVWITGGFSGVVRDDDSETTHAAGEFAHIVGADSELSLMSFWASNGQEDASVSDIVEKIVAISGGQAVFPGDIQLDDAEINSNGIEL